MTKLDKVLQERIIQAKQFDTFSAYQHFLYYIDTKHLEKEKPWGAHMTNHFMSKLHAADIHSIVSWVQEMSHDNQFLLLGYILKHHSNKW